MTKLTQHQQFAKIAEAHGFYIQETAGVLCVVIPDQYGNEYRYEVSSIAGLLSALGY